MFDRPDPLTRLFDMHLAHGTAQLDLARALLEINDAQAKLERIHKKLNDGGLTEKEADEQLSAADHRVDKLRGEIKAAIKALTGVPWSAIEEANL